MKKKIASAYVKLVNDKSTLYLYNIFANTYMFPYEYIRPIIGDLEKETVYRVDIQKGSRDSKFQIVETQDSVWNRLPLMSLSDSHEVSETKFIAIKYNTVPIDLVFTEIDLILDQVEFDFEFDPEHQPYQNYSTTNMVMLRVDMGHWPMSILLAEEIGIDLKTKQRYRITMRVSKERTNTFRFINNTLLNERNQSVDIGMRIAQLYRFHNSKYGHLNNIDITIKKI
jgi:hypothetical protein